MRQNNPLLRSALTVFGFWWLFFTLRDFSMSPLEMIRNWAYIGYSARLWAIGGVSGVAAGAWFIWFKRAGAQDALVGVSTGPIISTLGMVPMLAPAPPRITNVKQRLPLTNPVVNEWLASAKDDHAEYVELFLAIWDTYSAHRNWPASHRKGGHNNRRLWEHCLAVVETSLLKAPFFKYDGVTIKIRGKSEQKIIQPLKPDFVFNASDPLIPLLALAHDIGKLEAYKLKDDGSVSTSETGTGQDFDDTGVHHDRVGSRILARIPEFWALPASDRQIVNWVVSYYHHPNSFPVERNGLSLGDRMCSLLQFLILSDKETGRQESGQTEEDEAESLTEDDATAIYNAFVEIVTEHGRINGVHGDAKADSHFTIGAKHDGLIIIKENPLRKLILAKLNKSIEPGAGQYKVPMSLLQTLIEKGLLYTVHNGTDFTRYSPLWIADFYNSRNAKHIALWERCIIIKLNATSRELDILNSLPDKKSRMNISKNSYAHNPGIRDPKKLLELNIQCFGEEVGKSIKIPTGKHDLLDPEDDEAQVANATAVSAVPTEAKASAPAVATAPKVETAATVTPAPAAVKAPLPSAVPVPAPVLATVPAVEPTPVAIPAESGSDASDASSTPPWDTDGEKSSTSEPHAPAARSVETELDADDVPDMGGDDDSDGDGDGQVMGSVDRVDEGLDDLFGDFPSAPTAAAASSTQVPPAPAAAPAVEASPPVVPVGRALEPEIGHSPRDTVVLDKLRQGSATVSPKSDVSLIPKDSGKTVRNEDAPPMRDFTKGDRAKEAMKALQAAGGTELSIAPSERKQKRRRDPLTVEALQQLVETKRVEVSGEREGHSWVFKPHLLRVAGADSFLEAQTNLKLPVQDIGNGRIYLGIPLRSPKQS